MEIDPQNVANCIAAGVNVIQGDIDAGLTDFETASFDHVVMTQALQALQRPDEAIAEILRVGRTGIVTFPNRSEEHTSELQSLMRISYAVFCLKKKTTQSTKCHST